MPQVNQALAEIQALFIENYKIKARGRKHKSRMTRSQLKLLQAYEQCEDRAHEGQIFVTESQIRETEFYGQGKGTAQALLHSLRNLNRLKMVRSRSSENTYVIKQEA